MHSGVPSKTNENTHAHTHTHQHTYTHQGTHTHTITHIHAHTFAQYTHTHRFEVAGVVLAYRQALETTALSGPTNFSQVIQHVVSQVEHAGGVEAKEYHVLLILTDGAVSDVKQTTSAIIGASELPMSIIIVGVGSASFGKMEQFDGDDQQLKSWSGSGRTSKRDIVQFVPFRVYESSGVSASSELAAAVLGELPDQFLSYMCEWKIQPGGEWGSRYTMPPGNWFVDSQVSSRDLDFSGQMENDGESRLGGADAAAAMFATGEDGDADACAATALYPDGFVHEES